MMRCNYTNPYLKHPETLDRLKTYMKNSKPKVEPCPVVNFIEEWREPLHSQDIHSDKKGLTTGKSWMPTG